MAAQALGGAGHDEHVNPTLGTLAEVAAALGMRLIFEPLDAGEQRQITPNRRGAAAPATGARR